MRSKTCRFQYIFKYRNTELLLLFSLMTPLYDSPELSNPFLVSFSCLFQQVYLFKTSWDRFLSISFKRSGVR